MGIKLHCMVSFNGELEIQDRYSFLYFLKMDMFAAGTDSWFLLLVGVCHMCGFNPPQALIL